MAKKNEDIQVSADKAPKTGKQRWTFRAVMCPAQSHNGTPVPDVTQGILPVTMWMSNLVNLKVPSDLRTALNEARDIKIFGAILEKAKAEYDREFHVNVSLANDNNFANTAYGKLVVPVEITLEIDHDAEKAVVEDDKQITVGNGFSLKTRDELLTAKVLKTIVGEPCVCEFRNEDKASRIPATWVPCAWGKKRQVASESVAHMAQSMGGNFRSNKKAANGN